MRDFDWAIDLQVRRSPVCSTAALMIGYKQKFTIVAIVDETPILECVFVRLLRRECQRHDPIIIVTVHRRRQCFETLHHNKKQSILCIECHVCQQQLTIVWNEKLDQTLNMPDIQNVPPGLP